MNKILTLLLMLVGITSCFCQDLGTVTYASLSYLPEDFLFALPLAKYGGQTWQKKEYSREAAKNHSSSGGVWDYGGFFDSYIRFNGKWLVSTGNKSKIKKDVRIKAGSRPY